MPRDRLTVSRVAVAAWFFLCLAICASSQTPRATPAPASARPMDLLKTRYELRIGEPAEIQATPETLDFLVHAKTRRVAIDGQETGGLVVAPSQTQDRILLAPSSKAKPGEYTVTVSAGNEAGEQRQTTLDVLVKPLLSVPAGATRPPVVLLNGWQTGFTNSCPVAASSATTFGNLAQYLVSDGVPVVYLFDNCVQGPNQSIETLAADLGAFLNSIKYDDGTQVPQIDLVAHSMGGLIARAYLAGIQSDDTFSPPAATLVRKLVLIATPNFGSFVAGNYLYELTAGSQSAELAPGSAFLWNLDTWNQRGDDLRGVDAIAVIGNAGSYSPSLLAGTLLPNASDGLVSLTSAALGFAAQASATRVVPYCHIDPSAFTNTVFGVFACNAAGIANVTSTAHYSGQIVRSFLAGTTAWSSIGTTPATDPYLDSNGGLFFAMVNTTGSYVSDMTAVQWGTNTLQNGADTGTIFYTDFISGTGTYTATSQSLGSINCGTLTQPTGYSWAVRCKIGATVFSVTPLADTSGRVLTAGTTVTLNGAALGSHCSACQVLAYPAGTTTSQALTVTSWQSTAISVNLPASLTGLVTLKVIAAAGTDTIGVMVAAAGSTSLSVSSQTLSFKYTAGGTAPAAQEVSITGGSGTLSWTASADSFWIGLSAASGTAPDTLSISVNPANLAAGSHSGTVSVTPTGAGATPVSIAVTLVVAGAQPAGTVGAVVNGASFESGIASGGWVSIFGANLSQRTYRWQASDIVNGMLPTSLQGVSVTVDGLPAYVEYISPSQINVLVPDDATEGPVQVQVTTAQQASNAISAQKGAFAPAFFTFNGTYVAALHADYSVVGAANLLTGTVTTPAKPGETIMLYGTGFGPATPAQPSGQLVTTAVPLANSAQITIGGMAATVVYSGLTEAGLYQFNVTVPSLPNGDATVAASVGGVASQTGVLLTVQQ